MAKKVYVGASFDAKEQAKEIAQHVMSKGCVVTSSWLFFENYEGMTGEELNKCIKSMDVAGVVEADELILFTDVPSTKGGFHTELGIALGWNAASEVEFNATATDGPLFLPPKRIVTVGENPAPSGFFHEVTNYPTIQNFKECWR